MIILNDVEFVGEAQQEMSLLNTHTAVNEIKGSFVTYAYSILYHRPWFGLFAYLLGSYLRNITSQNNGVNDFKVNKIKKSDLSLLFNKLNRFEAKVKLQRKNSFFLIKELEDTSLRLPNEKKNTYCNYYLFPIQFNNKEERDYAHIRLRDMGVDTAMLYGETPLKSKRFYGYKGDCPVAERVADTILTIPNYYTLEKRDLIKIVDSIKRVEVLL